MVPMEGAGPAALPAPSSTLSRRIEMLMDVTTNLEEGIAATRAGKKDLARTYFLNVVNSEPNNEIAWLWLIGVAPTMEQALRYIEQLLTINPRHARALEARAVLWEQLLVEEGTGEDAAHGTASTPQRRYLLGEALVEAQIITQKQLDEVLHQHANLLQRHKRMRLGELLVRLKIIGREQLDVALTAQADSMSTALPNVLAKGFGEFLVQHGVISSAQLCQGLAHQVKLKRRGQPAPLGEVLIRCGYLERLRLHSMLLEWHHQMVAAHHRQH